MVGFTELCHWWMDVGFYWRFISKRSGGEKLCRPLKHLIPVFFTVNPQWSHQYWYKSGCENYRFSKNMNESRQSDFLMFEIQTLAFFPLPSSINNFTLTIFSVNVSWAHLRQISHTAIQSISTHKQSHIFLECLFILLKIFQVYNGGDCNPLST